MGREIKRVPLDFDAPLGEVWTGYLMPDDLDGIPFRILLTSANALISGRYDRCAGRSPGCALRTALRPRHKRGRSCIRGRQLDLA